jgi:hypothetical protein
MEQVERTSLISNESEQLKNQNIYKEINNNVPEGSELLTENTDSDVSRLEMNSDYYDSDNSATDKTWMPNKRNRDFISEYNDSDSSFQTSREIKKKKKSMNTIYYNINNNDSHVSQSNVQTFDDYTFNEIMQKHRHRIT